MLTTISSEFEFTPISTKTDYELHRRNMLLWFEESGHVSLLPYADSVGLATIGIGFNFSVATNLSAVVIAMGFAPQTTEGNGGRVP